MQTRSTRRPPRSRGANVVKRGPSCRTAGHLCEPLERRTLLALIVPPLNSLPGAAKTLYLDFDGSAPFLWDGARSGTPYVVRGPSPDDAPIEVPPFDTDGDLDSFSFSTDGKEVREKEQIEAIHAWVAEKFSPFAINVTTVDPGVVADNQNITCLIGGSDRDWYAPETPAGGVASLEGLYDGGEKTCFAFSGDVAGSPRLVQFLAETIAHEAGHVIGLRHQRHTITPFNVDDYYDGDMVRAPIMGGSSTNGTGARGIWWLTDNPDWSGQISPDPRQDDLARLTNPSALSLRNDDYNTNNPANAPLMTFNTAGVLAPLKGVIEQRFDIDDFRFHATGARVSFQVTNAPFGGMLAPDVSIRAGAAGPALPLTPTLTNTGATIEATNLTPGTEYVLRVAGQRQYGDIGQYTVTGSIQQFATFDAASGTVNVGGFVGHNNVTLSGSVWTNLLTVEATVNGGPVVRQTFPLGGVDNVVVFLGRGDDVLNVGSLVHASGFPVEVSAILGGGFDTLRLGSDAVNSNVFDVTQFQYEWTFIGGGVSRVRDSGSERVELIGTHSPDVFNIHSQPFFGNLHVFGHGDDDRLNVGPEVVASHAPAVIFDGGDGFDTLELDGLPVTTPQRFIVFNNTVQRFVEGTPIAAETQFGTAVETLRVRGGSGGDRFEVYGLRAGMTAFLVGADGDDEFRVGDSANPILALPFSANVRGIVNVDGGGHRDRLVVDDTAWGSGATYAIDSFGVRNTFVGNWVQYNSTLDRVDFHGRGGETTTLTTPLTNQEFHLFNGIGNGVGALTVDDRSGLSGPVAIDLHPGHIARRSTVGPFQQIHYAGFESLTVFTNNSTHLVNVYGTSPDVTTQTTIRTGTGDDDVTVYPVAPAAAPAAAGTSLGAALTFASPLGVFGGGGSDRLIVDATGSPTPIDYVFNNVGGTATANIFGLGAAGVGAFNDVEAVVVRAGAGNDTFAVDSFRNGAGFRIEAGDGDDVLQFGNDGLAAVTSLAFFDFNGGPGTDAFNLNNQTHAGTWTYTRDAGSIAASSTLGAGYFLTDSNTELMRLNGGPSGETFNINAVATGSAFEINAAGGVDIARLTPAAGSGEAIRGPVAFHAGADGGNVVLFDSFDATGDTFHLTRDALGATPGDNLFGPGGSLHFSGLTDASVIVAALTLHLGSGSDAAYAQPLASGTAVINLNGQTGPGAAGDALTLALAGAAEYVVTETTPSAGDVTSDTTGRLRWNGLDAPLAIDDAAPQVTGVWVGSTAWSRGFMDHLQSTGAGDAALGYALPLNGHAAPLPWTSLNQVTFRFGEDVVAGLASLAIPGLNVARYTVTGFSYDPATFTATWTLSGPLWADRLTLAPAAGVTDAAGNPLSPFALPLDVLPGDADRSGSVTALDLIQVRSRIRRSTASPGAATTRQYTPFHDLDGNGAIGVLDLMHVRRNGGKRLPSDTTAALPATAPITTAVRVPFSVRRMTPLGGREDEAAALPA